MRPFYRTTFASRLAGGPARHSLGGLLLMALLFSLGGPALAVQAHPPTTFYNTSGERYFSETGHTVRRAFLDYWNRQGGLLIFGYPISDEFQEVNADDGQTYTVQYFERNRFEYHPQNLGSPYEVLLARFGALLTRSRASAGEQAFQALPVSTASQPDRLFFKETAHTLGGRFLDYWNKHGGLAVFGYPLSQEFEEVSPTDGHRYLVQYFERNRFELHPEFAGTDYEVLLGLLGSEFLKRPASNTSAQPTPTQPGPAAPQPVAAPDQPAPARPSSNPGVKTAGLSLNGVDLSVSGSFVPDPQHFVSSQPGDVSQVATSFSLQPYQELSITAVPFGTKPGTEQLPVAVSGGAASYRDTLHKYRVSQSATFQPAPAITLFGNTVSGEASILGLKPDALTTRTVLIAEWVVEAGNRLWIVRASQELTGVGSTSERQQLLSNLGNLKVTASHFGDSQITQAVVTGVQTEQEAIALSNSAAVPANTNASAAPRDGSTDLPYPAIWNGQACDKGRHPTAVTFTSYRNVLACGPRPAFDSDPYADLVVRYFPGAWGVLEFECVEYSMRFMYLAYQVNPYGANGSGVVPNYSGDKLHKVGNGTADHAPLPGDVLSYGATSTAGHTSVVKSSSVDSSGNGSITVIEQNNSRAGTSTLQVKNWRVYAFSTVSGWLTTGQAGPSGGDDTTPPVSTLTVSGTTGQNGYYVSTATATLTGKDEDGGSGLDYSEYSYDNTNWTRYSAPFTLPEGTTTVYYRSVDKAGNKENAKSLVVKVDTRAPAVTYSLAPAANSAGWLNKPGNLNVSASDPLLGSGLAGIHVSFTADNGLRQPDQVYPGSSATVNFTASGTYVVKVWAADLAGNLSAPIQLSVKLDLAPPELQLTYDTQSHQFKLITTDSYSGPATAPLTIAEGAQTYQLSDLAGNTLTVELDTKYAGHDAQTEITHLSYASYEKTGSLNPASNQTRVNWGGQASTIKSLNQEYKVNGAFAVRGKYEAGKNLTDLTIEETGKPSQNLRRPGLVLVELVSHLGQFTYGLK